MPRYLVERTFDDGLAIPATAEGAEPVPRASSTATSARASPGCTPTSATTAGETFCVYDGPDPEAIRRGRLRQPSCRSTASRRSASSTRTSTSRRGAAHASHRCSSGGGHRRRRRRRVPRRVGDDAPVHPHATSPRIARAGRPRSPARGSRSPRSRPTSPARRPRGYKLQITPMMPDMGYHFMNPDVEGFDVRRPPILVYVRRGRTRPARGRGMGLPEQAGEAAAAGRALRLLRCRLPLRRRDVHARRRDEAACARDQP